MLTAQREEKAKNTLKSGGGNELNRESEKSKILNHNNGVIFEKLSYYS
jgi:hypothetical protein